MPSFVDVANGANADASTIQQVVDALKGTAGKGVPLSPTAVNDAINFALAVKNNDAGASKTAVFYKADGSVLLQVDKNGVVASPDGAAAAAQVVNVSMAQTLTNKTLTSPVITGAALTTAVLTSPVLNGVLTGTAGLNAWTAFTPTMSQTAGLTLSVATGRYTQIGKLVVFTLDITINSAGTAGGQIAVGSLPVASLQHGSAGFGFYSVNGGIFYSVMGEWTSSTAFLLFSGNTTNVLGASPAVTAGASDRLFMTGVYEST